MQRKTVFITGSSSGIGLLTAKYFHSKGWNVIASARSLNKILDWTEETRLLKVYVDVTDAQSIKSAIEKSIKRFGTIDVLINNAGLGNFGLFEDMSESQIDNLLDVNIKGVFSTTRYFLPHFRKNKSGVIINLSSLVGQVPTPLMSLYSSTKFAVEGFFEALKMELYSFNIKVRIVEPGPYNTGFGDASLVSNDSIDDEIVGVRFKINKLISDMIDTASPGNALDVVKVIYKSANSKSNRLRYSVGIKAKIIIFFHAIIPNRLWTGVVGRILKFKLR